MTAASPNGQYGLDLQRIAIEHIPEAVSVHDIEGRYLWASPGFLELFGLDPHDLVGRQAYDLFHPEDIPEIEASHETIAASPTSYTVKYRILRGDQRFQWVESVSRRGEPPGVIVSATRPIDPRPALDALESERLLTDRFRELARQQEGFLTAISHHARNPLTIVYGLAEVLSTRWRDLEEDRIDDLLGRLLSNTTKLSELLSDVTVAEQLSRRARRVTPRPVDLGRIAREQVADLGDSTSSVHVDITSGRLVFADPEMLGTALQILIHNADRHTPEGTTVRVAAERGPEGTTIVIDDDGPGVPEADRDAIFTAFHRSNQSDHDPGLGLGLSIVAEIAAVHHGRVWVEERDGGGASFRILFPSAIRKGSDRHHDIDLSSTDSEPDVWTRPLTIVAVDDDRAVLTLLKMTLEAEGHHVHIVDNGRDALTEIRDRVPDLVILDIMMSDLEGTEVTRTIRSTPTIRHIPVLICSALDGDASRWDTRVAGADGYIAKPFHVDDLLAAVRLVTDRSRRRVSPGPRRGQS